MRQSMSPWICASLLSLCLPAYAGVAHAKMSIASTKHNLSFSGPGEVKALSESRICIFCHTPHNAHPATPLWNREIKALNYTLYESSTLNPQTNISQPTGPSRLCLSCHDGTIALGKVLSSSTEIAFSSRYVHSSLGTDLSDDHPVSFSYFTALPNEELNPALPHDLHFYGSGSIHCSTCHDAHDDANGKFLAVDNRFSALCTKCHSKKGWADASHNLSMAAWNNVHPNPWPHNQRHSPANQWLTVRENGCLNCHRPHTAGGPKRLLNFLAEEENCYPCHNGNVARKNIQAEFSKSSAHRVEANTIGLTQNAHDPAESPLNSSWHVECADCHNPHASHPDSSPVQAPYAGGALALVTGLDRNGLAVKSATFEYEICFKCHTETNQVPPYVQRVQSGTNLRLKFSTTNPSYHPVIGVGRNADVPSLPNVAYAPDMNESSHVFCTDCHDSNDSPKIGGSGAKGPHGSAHAPLLRERYETAAFTPESHENFALCYRCHERRSILADESFQKKTLGATMGRGGHSGHLVAGVPCSACHDPHGVRSDGFTGDHTHLINFDVLIVTPVSGENAPFFTDHGSRSGGCTLVCHGRTHLPRQAGADPNTVDSSYP
jgi:predicted CXXCH cytochrome family protein